MYDPIRDNNIPLRKTLRFLLALGLVSLVRTGTAAPFTQVTTSLPGTCVGGAAFGDFNNDGLLDILITGNSDGGNPVTQVWKNMGNGVFSNINVPIPGVSKSSVAWGDYDNDGYLDILVSGLNSQLLPICQIWHNQGNGTFVNSGIALPGVSGSAVAWADLNNDGKLDLILAGADANGLGTTQIWMNQGGGNFTKNNSVTLPAVILPSLAVGDLNNDGYLDIVLTGYDVNNLPVVQVLRNLGNGTFVNVSSGLPAIAGGTVTLADYDGDGYLDVLLTGFNAANQVLGQLWRNLGNLTFANVNAGLPGVYSGQAAWGDYDNDGKPDILLSGYVSGVPVTQVWRNQGGGVFANINAGLTSLSSSMVAWGDFDNSGKLDILAAGVTSSSAVATTLWANQATVANVKPTAPTGLSASPTSSGATLSWLDGTDTTTPVAALTYNIRVGTSSGGFNVVSPMADPSTGFRRVVARGNAGTGNSLILNLPPGNYYWSVQAEDASYSASLFATESSFTIKNTATTSFAGQVNALGGFAVGSAVGLTGGLDVLVPGPKTNTLQFNGGILTGVLVK